ncbi:MAG TPA: hypothetical protein VKE92_04915 [Anaerolineales bacterium]|jgi:hypothetical protein|nr:hypothetical protein [Anaerolineales bacterium]
MEDGYLWSHFRAPDGFIYKLSCSPKHLASARAVHAFAWSIHR